jgi:3-oxoacyl-[acyl-carrier protein] reductase
MDLGLAGKVALVAAGSSGLGLAVAKELAAEGAHVAICGRDAARLARASEEVRKAGQGEVLADQLDVRDEAAAADWVARTAVRLGALHVVVTNAGGPPPGPVLEFGLAAHREALELCLLSHIGLVRAALPHLRAAGWGRILMIASETVRQPSPVYGLSSTARAGLAGFARVLVPELADSGVTVNVLAPGYHLTAGVEAQLGPDREASLAAMASGIPVRRLGRPEEFGAAAAFLASERAAFITGTTLLADGGATKGIC